MNERIKEVRKALGLSQEDFGKRLGVTRGAIVNIELSRAQTKPLFIKHICEVFGINEEWLQTGNGKMFLPMSEEEQLHQIFTEIEFSDDTLIKKIVQAYWRLDDKEKAVIHKMIDSFSK